MLFAYANDVFEYMYQFACGFELNTRIHTDVKCACDDGVRPLRICGGYGGAMNIEVGAANKLTDVGFKFSVLYG